MIKNSFKFIILTILVIIANACSSNSNSFWGFKPHFLTGTYINSYAIIEDGKINRMGIPKEDIDKMVDLKKEATENINRIQDSRCRIVLSMYYLSNLTFEEIAENVHYSYRWVRRIHKKGIKELREKLTP